MIGRVIWDNARPVTDERMAMNIRKVGVIGAGQMGNGIAHVAALAGFDVLLNDVAEDRIKSALATIDGNLKRLVAKSGSTDDARKAALGRIKPAASMDALADCDIVIESAAEKEEIKRKIFHDLCAVLKQDAIVASNTSSISITRLAAATDRPERFIGIHFMNPVPRMELVEIIRGIATEDATFETSKAFVTQARQADRGVGGFSGVHRQPHPAADDQRGDLHAL